MRYLILFLVACTGDIKIDPTDRSTPVSSGEGEGETATPAPIEPDYEIVWSATATRDFAGYDVAILDDGSTLVSVPGAATVYRVPAIEALGTMRDLATAEITGEGGYFAVHVSTVVTIDGVELVVLGDEYAGDAYEGTSYLVDPVLLDGVISAPDVASYSFAGIEPGAFTGPVLVADFDGDGGDDLALSSASVEAPYLYVFSGGREPGAYSVADADQQIAIPPSGGVASYACGALHVSPDGTQMTVGGPDVADADGVIDVYDLPFTSTEPTPTDTITATSGRIAAWGANGALYAGSRKRDEVQVRAPDGSLSTLVGADGFGADIDTLTLEDGRELVAIGEQGAGAVLVYLTSDLDEPILTLTPGEGRDLAWCGASVDLRQIGDQVLLAAGCWQEVVGTGAGGILYRLTL